MGLFTDAIRGRYRGEKVVSEYEKRIAELEAKLAKCFNDNFDFAKTQAERKDSKYDALKAELAKLKDAGLSVVHGRVVIDPEGSVFKEQIRHYETLEKQNAALLKVAREMRDAIGQFDAYVRDESGEGLSDWASYGKAMDKAIAAFDALVGDQKRPISPGHTDIQRRYFGGEKK